MVLILGPGQDQSQTLCGSCQILRWNGVVVRAFLQLGAFLGICSFFLESNDSGCPMLLAMLVLHSLRALFALNFVALEAGSSTWSFTLQNFAIDQGSVFDFVVLVMIAFNLGTTLSISFLCELFWSGCLGLMHSQSLSQSVLGVVGLIFIGRSGNPFSGGFSSWNLVHQRACSSPLARVGCQLWLS
jgi:hypothetical protein